MTVSSPFVRPVLGPRAMVAKERVGQVGTTTAIARCARRQVASRAVRQ